MKLLKFEKKSKRDKLLAVRLPQESVKKLKAIAATHDVSQSEVIERLIDVAHGELANSRKKS